MVNSQPWLPFKRGFWIVSASTGLVLSVVPAARADSLSSAVPWDVALPLASALLVAVVAVLWNRQLQREVRERRRAEQLQRTAEDQFKEIFDNAPVGITRTSPDGAVLGVNPEMMRIAGYETFEEILATGQRLDQGWYHDPQDRQRFIRLLEGHGHVRDFEYRAIKKDGALIWVSQNSRATLDEQGKLVHLDGFIQDITDRKRVVEALADSEARLKAIVGNSPFVIATDDGRGGLTYLSDSRIVEKITGHPLAILQGGKFMEHVHPEDALRIEYEFHQFLQARGQTVQLNYRWQCADGSWRHLEANGENFANDPNYKGILYLIRDVTREKEAEAKLIRAKLAAEEASRAKSDFLASMSHELRTPMNAILGMAEVLAESDISPEQQEYVSVFKTAGENLLEIINDILDLTKIEAGHICLDEESFSLAEVVERCCQLLAPKANEKGVELTYRLDPALPVRFKGDPKRLRQVLSNLVGNAVKFTHQGFIDLRVQPDPAGGEPGAVLFRVRDTGIGISADKRKAIFESFVQADSTTTREYGGTGLGLTISRELVEIMGGAINVTSRRDKGSVFSFTVNLPASDKPEAEAVPDAFLDEQNMERALPEARVLFAEDSEFNRAVVKAFLQNTKLVLVEAMNGREAVELFETESFDLVLMDIQMPGMDGYEATRRIRAMETDRGASPTPVLALTAFALKGDAQKALDAGCDAHIPKPVQKVELLREFLKHLA